MCNGQSPIMLGPLFVHQSKSYEVLQVLCICTYWFETCVVHYTCFGTDREAALVKAFKTQFGFAIHLRCF